MTLEVATSESHLTRENDGSVSLNGVRYTRSVALRLDAAIITYGCDSLTLQFDCRRMNTANIHCKCK